MNITASELKSRMNTENQPMVVDVRDDWEYQEQNIGALNIPLGSLSDRVDELEEYKDQELVVHCRSGSRSRAAQLYLQQQGFNNVRNLEGGILAYLAE
jgi:rhodanese-related sulfurtransferase